MGFKTVLGTPLWNCVHDMLGRETKTTKPYVHTVFTDVLKSTVSGFYREKDHMVVG